jgi:DNA-binding NarL/FixJ family response regulator
MMSNSVRVLIVDDSTLVCERLVALFKGYERIQVVGQAVNAAQAISGIRALRPQAVILDLHMPCGGGFQVLRDLQIEPDDAYEFPHQAKPLIIVLTNYYEQPYREKALAAGADFFLDKSSQFDQVVGLLVGIASPPPFRKTPEFSLEAQVTA